MVAVTALEPDAELMLRVKDGDAASFALLLERHRSPVIHFLYRMVQNQAVAEELAVRGHQVVEIEPLHLGQALLERSLAE